MTEQPPGYPPPPPGGYGYPSPSGGYGYPPPSGGYGYPPPSGYPPPQSAGTNSFAIASLVCSLLGGFCLSIGALLGIIFGFVALSQIKRTGQSGRGMAIAGIVIGAVIMVVGLIWLVVALAFRHPSGTDYGTSAMLISVAAQSVWPSVAA